MKEDDLVVQAIETAHQLFQKARFGRAFVNGKLEITAKALLSAGWEASSGGRIAVMDKHFNQAPIDFLALENQTPVFWIESKFDNFRKPGETRKQARDAVRQALKYKKLLRKKHWPEIKTLGSHDLESAQQFTTKLGKSPAYIIHFLNYLPEKDELPHLIYRKFLAGVPAKIRDDDCANTRPEQAPITMASLSSYYQRTKIGKEKKVEVRCFPIWKGVLWEREIDGRRVGISAVVVRIP